MDIRHSVASKVFESRSTVIARGFTAKNYSIKRHDHDFYEVNIVVSGRGVHLVGDAEIPASVGDVFVIPPGVVHGYESEGRDFDVYHVIAKKEFFEKYSAELAASHHICAICPLLRSSNSFSSPFLAVFLSKTINLCPAVEKPRFPLLAVLVLTSCRVLHPCATNTGTFLSCHFLPPHIVCNTFFLLKTLPCHTQHTRLGEYFPGSPGIPVVGRPKQAALVFRTIATYPPPFVLVRVRL